ncbi:MAG: glycerophosphodiester phosphodiesterase [Acidimicrobiales bacterium MED-G01]|nr:MAG: glycerophosphodiester phosphodiesterase [Acidimicrobiales bacterium MED-G01]
MENDVLVQQRLPSLRKPAIQFAHRGARANAPENTLDAFELALRLGATGLETDVWLTSDGVPVLDHDGVVRVGIRRKSISKILRVDLPTQIPSLEDLYRACGSNFELSIDLKDSDAYSQVVSLARDFQAEARLWLCHPTWELLAGLRSETCARLVNSTRVKDMKDGPERRAAELAAAGIDAVNLHHSDWSGGLTTLFHRFNRYCIAWDAQHVRVIRDLVRMGIDGVHSDHVDRLQTGFSQAG